MTITWLGQAGFLIESSAGTKIMIDPYLSDSLHELNGDDFIRQVPIDECYLDMRPDALILSHCHADHTDPATLQRLLKDKEPFCVLAPLNTWRDVRARFGGEHNYIQFDRGVQWTLNDVTLKAVFALHTDEYAIGIIIETDGKTLYHTGDTLYHRDLPKWLDGPVDTLVLPINGKGCNMNAVDAYKLTKLLAPKKVLPMHHDMFKKAGCDVQEFTSLFTEQDGVEILLPEHYCPVEL